MTCRDCQREVSPSARRCPHCGALHPSLTRGQMSFRRTGNCAGWLVLIIVGIIIVSTCVWFVVDAGLQ